MGRDGIDCESGRERSQDLGRRRQFAPSTLLLLGVLVSDASDLYF